jgi:hypothetical protein
MAIALSIVSVIMFVGALYLDVIRREYSRANTYYNVAIFALIIALAYD